MSLGPNSTGPTSSFVLCTRFRMSTFMLIKAYYYYNYYVRCRRIIPLSEEFSLCVLLGTGVPSRDMAVTSSPPVLRRGRSVGQRSGRPPLESQATVSGVSPVPSPYRTTTAGGATTTSTTGRESPVSRATSLDTRSRSPSPHAGAPPHANAPIEYYGTAKLTDRSRSPSPTPSLPVELERRPRPRPPPQKPTALDLPLSGRRRVGGVGGRGVEDRMPHVLPSPTVPPPPHRSPGSINFPRLSPSPSHAPWDLASPTSPGSSPLLPRSASSQLIGHAHRGEVGGTWAGHGAARQQRYPSQQALPLRPEPRYHQPQRPIRAEDLGVVHRAAAPGTGTLPPHSFRLEPVVGGAGAVPRPTHWGRDSGSPRDVDDVDEEKASDSEDEDWC